VSAEQSLPTEQEGSPNRTLAEDASLAEGYAYLSELATRDNEPEIAARYAYYAEYIEQTSPQKRLQEEA
jgi:hypothetical protein